MTYYAQCRIPNEGYAAYNANVLAKRIGEDLSAIDVSLIAIHGVQSVHCDVQIKTTHEHTKEGVLAVLANYGETNIGDIEPWFREVGEGEENIWLLHREGPSIPPDTDITDLEQGLLGQLIRFLKEKKWSLSGLRQIFSRRYSSSLGHGNDFSNPTNIFDILLKSAKLTEEHRTAINEAMGGRLAILMDHFDTEGESSFNKECLSDVDDLWDLIYASFTFKSREFLLSLVKLAKKETLERLRARTKAADSRIVKILYDALRCYIEDPLIVHDGDPLKTEIEDFIRIAELRGILKENLDHTANSNPG